jgi:hypothetical protein
MFHPSIILRITSIKLFFVVNVHRYTCSSIFSITETKYRHWDQPLHVAVGLFLMQSEKWFLEMHFNSKWHVLGKLRHFWKILNKNTLCQSDKGLLTLLWTLPTGTGASTAACNRSSFDIWYQNLQVMYFWNKKGEKNISST